MSQFPEIAPAVIESAKHEEEAFVELYRFYVQRVHRFLLVKTSNVQLAEDLTQETFVTVMNKLDTYTVTGAKFSSWLLQIALNHARMYFRKKSNAATVDLDVVVELSSGDGTQQQQWTDFFMALHKLSNEEQELLTFKYVEDMSNQDIAEVLGVLPNSCGVKIHRALKRLQEYL